MRSRVIGALHIAQLRLAQRHAAWQPAVERDAPVDRLACGSTLRSLRAISLTLLSVLRLFYSSEPGGFVSAEAVGVPRLDLGVLSDFDVQVIAFAAIVCSTRCT